MDCFTTLENIPESAQGCVLAIGNFDGVHRGHQALLSKAQAEADRLGKKLAVLTFEPHPRALLRPDDPPFRLTPFTVKEQRLAASGVAVMFSPTFDWDFASQSAQIFIDKVLKSAIRPAHIFIGPDFRFGQMRQGTPDMLAASGISTTILHEKMTDGTEDISSSRIRQALRHGDIDTANKLLGWHWHIDGIVVQGDQRGRTIGYPTANVHLGETLHPSYGVYATFARIVEDGPDAPWLPAATNIGIRPMFEVPVGQVETYIFDFSRDIYGKTLQIRPVKRLRGEARFDTLEALVTQIEADCRQAAALLGSAS